ncbi:MAG TPA: carboxypeptidase regulatory-like domain-containing protein, partial [Gemmatimonadaceae bacterium]|nr:carboxypeptidase regulatory-like domain-containing protein [Gemmatimonadaceae bacterium]
MTLLVLTAAALEAQATGTIRGRVTATGATGPVANAQVLVDGTTMRAMTNAAGEFIIPGVPPGSRSVTARRIGFAPTTRTVAVVAGQTVTVTIEMGEAASHLDAVVVTALGEQAERRTIGTSQQTVQGTAIAETGRENFINSLQGRIAGVEVNSSSGVPGASTQITIRGVSSISSSNQPLFIIDGMPMDNKTLHSSAFA